MRRFSFPSFVSEDAILREHPGLEKQIKFNGRLLEFSAWLTFFGLMLDWWSIFHTMVAEPSRGPSLMELTEANSETTIFMAKGFSPLRTDLNINLLFL